VSDESNDAKRGTPFHFLKKHLVLQGDILNRKQWIAAISIFALLVLLIVSALVLARNNKQASVERRFPLQALGYCTSNEVKPCVVSFSLDSKGNMLVNFLTDGAFYPDFYLKIKTDEKDYLYVCQKVSKVATSVYCTGRNLPLGKIFQFLIFSLNEDVLLAQGNFPIIGMALGTPGIYLSPTPTTTPGGTSTPSYPSYPNARP
jgi:hypothetical protein